MKHHPSHFACVEGLGLKTTISSSLVGVHDYRNASLYIDVSDNKEYKSFKVSGSAQ
jgi:hypothetical protein